jgi:hypothetical protein
MRGVRVEMLVTNVMFCPKLNLVKRTKIRPFPRPISQQYVKFEGLVTPQRHEQQIKSTIVIQVRRDNVYDAVVGGK